MFFFHSTIVYFFLLAFLFLATALTLSTRRCFTFSTSSSVSLPVMRPSSTALGSLVTLSQTFSFFTTLLVTRSAVNLVRWRVCSSENLLQKREDSLKTEAAFDVDGAFVWQSSRNFRTFSLFVIGSIGGSTFSMLSCLIWRSFRTTAFVVCVERRLVSFSFLATCCSWMPPVSSSA